MKNPSAVPGQRKIKPEDKAYLDDRWTKSSQCDLRTDEGFAEFCRHRCRTIHPQEYGVLWTPKKVKVHRDSWEYWEFNHWLPIDDEIQALIGTSSRPRIDLKD